MAQQQTVKRPTTCDAMAAIDPALGSKGCKRLPRHGGEHRGHLTAAAERRAVKAAAKVAKPKAAPKGRKVGAAGLTAIVRDIRQQVGKPRGRLTAAERRQALGLLAGLVDAGKVTASQALGLTVKFA